jgi:hypothetical protein
VGLVGERPTVAHAGGSAVGQALKKAVLYRAAAVHRTAALHRTAVVAVVRDVGNAVVRGVRNATGSRDHRSPERTQDRGDRDTWHLHVRISGSTHHGASHDSEKPTKNMGGWHHTHAQTRPNTPHGTWCTYLVQGAHPRVIRSELRDNIALTDSVRRWRSPARKTATARTVSVAATIRDASKAAATVFDVSVSARGFGDRHVRVLLSLFSGFPGVRATADA